MDRNSITWKRLSVGLGYPAANIGEPQSAAAIVNGRQVLADIGDIVPWLQWVLVVLLPVGSQSLLQRGIGKPGTAQHDPVDTLRIADIGQRIVID